MFLRDEAHKSSPTECSPVHVVSPSPVSWVPEVHPSSEKTASEKRSPGTAFRPGWEKLFTGSKASEPPAEKKKPYCPWRSRLPECVKTGAILVLAPPLLVPPNWDSGLLGEGFRCRFLQTAKGYCNENSLRGKGENCMDSQAVF